MTSMNFPDISQAEFVLLKDEKDTRGCGNFLLFFFFVGSVPVWWHWLVLVGLLVNGNAVTCIWLGLSFSR